MRGLDGLDFIALGAQPDRQRIVRGVDGLDLVSLGAQPDGQQPQQAGVVFDEQDVSLGTGILVGLEI